MREFLYSDIAAVTGISNFPDDSDVAIAAGKQLCTQLLEPLQDTFGRLAIRSAYRSSAVNAHGNANGYGCASNAKNHAHHIWDKPDADGYIGATACVVVPKFYDHFSSEGDWRKLAWWVHDHLPYSKMFFFPKLWAFNLSWHERPVRRIDSHAKPKGCLIKPGMANHGGPHSDEWGDLRSIIAS